MKYNVDGSRRGTVYRGVYLHGRDPAAEARLQADEVPRGAQVAWCYGTGAGHLPAELLRRHPQVAVVIMNREIARSTLAKAEWARDPRLKLFDGSKLMETPGPSAFSPVDVRLCDIDCAHHRERLHFAGVMEFNRIHVNANAERDLAQAKENIARGDETADRLFGSLAGARMVVCGAGPSLADQYDWLRDRGGPIISVNTALRPLLAAGIVPEFVIYIDPNEDRNKDNPLHLSVPASTRTRVIEATTLIYDPVVFPREIDAWPGRRFVATGPGELRASGTVVHAAVDLACKFGASEVTVLGADFCYPGMRSHVVGAPAPVDLSQMRTSQAINGRGETVETTPAFGVFRGGLEALIRCWPSVRFAKRGRAGLPVEGAPWAD